MNLYEKFRPRNFNDVIGNDETMKKLRFIKQAGFGGRAFWITGPSGTGKSTLARIIANEVAEEFNTIQLVADALTPAVVPEIEAQTMSYGFGALSGRAIIIEESHGLRRDSLRRLLVALERVPKHVVWCFTTSETNSELYDGTDLRPLLSRCIGLKTEPSNEGFAKHCLRIARREKLVRAGTGIASFRELAEQCSGNLRAMMQVIATGQFL